MRWFFVLAACVVMTLTIGAAAALAQDAGGDGGDSRVQFPPLLANSYFGLSVATISTPFTAASLQPGFSSSQIDTPMAGVTVTLFGHQFGQYLAAQIDYSRPFKWASFDNINGTGLGHSVWMALGEFKLRGRLPINDRAAVFGDVGFAITSRHGATADDGKVVIANAQYVAPLIGAGVEYAINERWSLQACLTRTGGSDEDHQPQTVVVGAGFRYHLHPLDAAQVREASLGGYVFPKHLIQIGYAYGGAGFGTNDFLSSTVPVFWGADLAVDHGFTIRYEQNLFHSQKRFAFDLGVSAARWHAQKSVDYLSSVSVYPILKYAIIRSTSVDVQVSYSLAGPTLLSSDTLDNVPTGTNRFTFQDLIGMAISTGKSRNILVGLGIGHYSNGNLLPINPGINIPLTVSLGYAF
jgi:hypothetical protein